MYKWNELQEIKPRGTPLFPIDCYISDVMIEGSVLHCHWHTQAQWLYICKGSGTFTIGSQKYFAKERETLYIPPQVLHSGVSNDPSGCGYMVLVYEPHDVYGAPAPIRAGYEPFRSGERTPNVLYRSEEEGGARINNIFTRMHAMMSAKEPGYEIRTIAMLQQVLYYWVRYELYHLPMDNQSAEGNTNNAYISHIGPALNYIHANYAKKITLEELADLSGLSSQMFCRYFKAALSTTAVNYMNNYRLHRAASLLLSTTLPVSEIAQASGFENTSYFIKLFKKARHQTPIEFRQASTKPYLDEPSY